MKASNSSLHIIRDMINVNFRLLETLTNNKESKLQLLFDV